MSRIILNSINPRSPFRSPWLCLPLLAMLLIVTASLAPAMTGCAPSSTPEAPPPGAAATGLISRMGTGADAGPAAAHHGTLASTTDSAASHFVGSSGSEVVVSGTSTVHDWTAKGTALNGEVVISGDWGNAPGIQIDSISHVIPVSTLKSSEGEGMDKTMYEALNRKQHPDISYRLTSATAKSIRDANGEYQFDSVGELTVSGNTRQVSLTLHLVPLDDTHIALSTSTSFKMSDFGITPPKAMLGMIKSGDLVNIKVTWKLAKGEKQ